MRMTANGEVVAVEPSPEPAGFEFTPGRSRELGADEARPCA